MKISYLRRFLVGIFILFLVLPLMSYGSAYALEDVQPYETAAQKNATTFASTRAAGPTVVAGLYADAAKTNLLATLTADGKGTFTWGYTLDSYSSDKVSVSDTVYLFIEYSNLDATIETTITLEMDQIVYIHSIPSGWTGTPNAALKVNKTKSYVGGQFSKLEAGGLSGTYTHTVTGSTYSSMEPIQLRFDPVLWKRYKGAPLKLDSTKPILKVTLTSGNTVSSVSVDNAYAGANHKHMYRRNLKQWALHAGGGSTAVSGNSVTIKPTDSLQFDIRAYTFYSSDFTYFYSKEFVVKLTLPKYTAPDGKTYTMEFVSFTPRTPDLGTYECTYEDDNGVVTVTYHNVCGTTNIIGDIKMKFPEMPPLDPTTYTFNADVHYYNDGYEVFESAAKITKYTVTMDNTSGSKLECTARSRDVDNEMTAGAVSPLGYYALQNTGNDPSNPVKISRDFDSNGLHVIGVTTMNLMADPKQKNMVIYYTLMDAAGNPVEGGKTYSITLTHSYSAATPGMHVTLSRTALPANQRQYYFKTVEYTLTEVPGKFNYSNATANFFATDNAGVYYGRSLTNEVNKSAKVLVQVTRDDGYVFTDLTQTLTTTTRSSRIIAFHVGSSKLTTPTGANEISAGDAWGLELGCVVYDYPYSQTTSIDGVRVGLLLPQGMVINESSLKASLANKTNVPVEKVWMYPVDAGSRGTENMWVIQLASGYPIGYYSENLGMLPNGVRVILSLQINTSLAVKNDTLQLSDRVFVAANQYIGKGLVDAVDIYDVNGNGKKTDSVGGVHSAASKSLKVNAVSAQVDDNSFFAVTGDNETHESLTLTSSGEIFEYKLHISNNGGGFAKNLAYYVEIPQDSLLGSVSLPAAGPERIVLKGPGVVNHLSGTKLKLLYTTTPGLTVDNVGDMEEAGSIAWSETLTDYQLATMVKVVTETKDADYINGSENEIVLQLAYEGTRFASSAGSSVEMNTYRSYDYFRGNYSMGVVGVAQSLKVTTYYIATGKTYTLTAALEMKPTAPNVNAVSITDLPTFINEQKFKIENLVLYNVTLGDFTQEQLNQKANEYFKISIQLNALAQLTVADNLNLGTSAAQVSPVFALKLFNGNALTDTTTVRYLTFDIVSDSVTLPVTIKIDRELATAGATVSSIIVGKEYLNAGENVTAIIISQDSAFTAQFVTGNLSDANYGDRILQFSALLPKGTTIALLDYSNESGLARYAHYTADGSKKEINLTEFKLMGSGTGYTINTGTDGSAFTEKLLFIVDFSQAESYLSGADYSVKMIIEGKSGIANAECTLPFKTTSARSFSATVIDPNRTYGESFQIQYSVNGPEADSRHNGRGLALVVDGSNLPADAYLLVGGKTYYQNVGKQIIVPLGIASENVTNGTISLQVISASLKENAKNCSVQAELWVSATADQHKPFQGRRIQGPFTINYTAAQLPALKITSMSDRVLLRGELADVVTLEYNYASLPANSAITLEIQKLSGSGYVTDSVFLEQVNGDSTNTQGVFTISPSTKQLSLNFSSNLEKGNYQVLMRIKDQNGNVLLAVPYRFIVAD